MILLKQIAILSLFCGSALSVSGREVFKVDHVSYLKKHDIVYLEPDYEGFNGFPIGNGDLGGMVWSTPSGIKLQMNKIDLYSRPEEGRMSLCSAGQVNIDFHVPCFEYLYLDDYEGRLSLQNGEVLFKGSTPFVDTRISTWVSAESNVWVIDCEADYKGSCASGSKIDVSLERWGSRPFRDWYNSAEKDHSMGLNKTFMKADNGDLILEDTLSGGLTFSVVCRVIDTDTRAVVLNNHQGILSQDKSGKKKFKVLLAVVTGEEAADPTRHALGMLDDTERKQVANVYGRHVAWWHDFWQQSFVHLEDDYIENIYYLRRYLMGASSRSKYLAPFNGSLWVWNHDHRQWATPHHWNTQESYWGLAAQNDCALMKPYLDTYFRLMPQAEKYAEKYGAKDALLWTEAHDFDGNMVSDGWGNMVHNYTPASQMASIFWEYYEFTEDKKCLQDTIYPFMKKAAMFYVQKLQWDKNRNEYFLEPVQPYEHAERSDLKNTITDRYMIESLFKNCIKAAALLKTDKEQVKQWQHIMNHLWEPPVLELPDRSKVFVMAYTPDDKPYPNAELYPKRQFYHFDAHTTQVFPAGVLGLDQQGDPYFEIARNVALRHPEHRNAITPGAIVSARLGLGEKVLERLSSSIDYLQHFNQGLFYNIDHWHGLSLYHDRVENGILETQRDYVFDARARYNSKNAGSSGLMAKPFIQCGMETMGIFGTAVNEMLLQSHEDKIRVFPAIPKGWETAFTLRARGGFMVSSLVRNDTIPGVVVESLFGNTCRLQNPWPDAKPLVQDANGKRVPFNIDKNGVITFKTHKNERYFLKLPGTMLDEVIFTGEVNTEPKKFGHATLGKERTFK